MILLFNSFNVYFQLQYYWPLGPVVVFQINIYFVRTTMYCTGISKFNVCICAAILIEYFFYLYSSPFFGQSICCNSEDEVYQWVGIMTKAQVNEMIILYN